MKNCVAYYSLGYGAILKQVKQIATRYGKFQNKDHRHSKSDLEKLAVVRAFKQFRHYLYGRNFTVETDCNAPKESDINKEFNRKIIDGGLFCKIMPLKLFTVKKND